MKAIDIIVKIVPTEWFAWHNHAYREAFFDEPRSFDAFSAGAKVVSLTWSNAVDFISVELRRGSHAVLREELE